MKTTVSTLINFAASSGDDEKIRLLAAAALLVFHEDRKKMPIEGNGWFQFQISRTQRAWKAVITYHYGNQKRSLVTLYKFFSKQAKKLLRQGGFIAPHRLTSYRGNLRNLSENTRRKCRRLMDRFLACHHKWVKDLPETC